MAVLAEIREKEAVIDDIISPVEDMYAMLARYEVSVPSHLSNTKHGCCKLSTLLRKGKVPMAALPRSLHNSGSHC